MRTKVFKRMKKQIAVFASVCVVVGLALTYVACSADEMTAEQLKVEEQFKDDLVQLRLNQQNIIHRTTRAASQFNYEDVLSIAEKVDKITIEFIVNHKDVLKKHLPKVALTQDSLDLLCIDEEAFESYLSDNYSETFVNKYYAILSNNDSNTRSLAANIDTIGIVSEELNPLESMLLVNTESFKELSALMPVDDDYLLYNSTMDKTLTQKCNSQYNKDINMCNIAASAVSIIGAVTVLAVDILSGGVAAAATFPLTAGMDVGALAVRVACVKAAEADRKKCMENK